MQKKKSTGKKSTHAKVYNDLTANKEYLSADLQTVGTDLTLSPIMIYIDGFVKSFR